MQRQIGRIVSETMARYFFDLRNDIDVNDGEGRHFADLGAATVHARKEAREMICASVEEGRDVDLRHKIEVREESGSVAAVVHFEDAVRFLRAGEPV